MKPRSKLKVFRNRAREFILKLFPQQIAHWWIRKSLDLSIAQRSTQIRFEIASNAQDLKQALSLVQRNFEREGYATRDSAGIRLTPYHILPETVVIVAKLDGQIVATISIIPRTAFGVPIDRCVSLDSVRGIKGRVVEISSLAVDPSIRGVQGEVLFNLMKYMYHCNIDVLKANTEVIGVNPKMSPLYEAILLFKRIPGTQTLSYDFANGAPVIPMYFDLDSALKAYGTAYAGYPSRQNVMEFFLAEPPAYFSLPQSEALDRVLPQRNSSQLREVLESKPELLPSFTADQLSTLLQLYHPWPECADVIQEFANAQR
jgi:hypothetical protein